jgi:hypothetical protein
MCSETSICVALLLLIVTAAAAAYHSDLLRSIASESRTQPAYGIHAVPVYDSRRSRSQNYDATLHTTDWNNNSRAANQICNDCDCMKVGRAALAGA